MYSGAVCFSNSECSAIAMVPAKRKSAKQYPKLTEHGFHSLRSRSRVDDLGKTVTLFSSKLFSFYLRKDILKQIHMLEEKRKMSQSRSACIRIVKSRMRSTMNSLLSEEGASSSILSSVLSRFRS